MPPGLRGKYDKPIVLFAGLDALFVILSFIASNSLINSVTSFYKDLNSIAIFLVFLFLWIVVSFYTKKYKISDYKKASNILSKLSRSNFLILSLCSIILTIIINIKYSRVVFIATFFFSTLFEFIVSYIYLEFQQSPFLREWMGLDSSDTLSKPLQEVTLTDKDQPRDFSQSTCKIIINDKDGTYNKSESRSILNLIISSIGEKAALWIANHVELNNPRALLVSTTTRFNIEQQQDNYFQYIINLAKINNILRVNRFFESVNKKLLPGGLYICRGETELLRKQRILARYPFIINYFIYTIDYIVKRVLPKLKITQKLYFLFSRGKDRVLSKSEILGRLYSCGFHVVKEKEIDGLFYCIASKIKEPVYDNDPTYGPLIRLRRIGRGGEIIIVYKLRTMHPYSEYIQQYMFDRNGSKDGDKVNDDFRVNTVGAFFRKFWLDELPMIVNLVKGDLKLVGVRPLSEGKFKMYPEEFQLFRIQFTPGLIPPFYADLPNSFDELIQSERTYLLSYQKNPICTDFKYFFKATYNIIFKKARSK